MISLPNILFLDIETVPQQPSYIELAVEWKALWMNKAAYLIRNKDEETVETIYNRAGIYAEFGKIICISVGIIQGSGAAKKLLLKSFYGDNEVEILQQFSEMLQRFTTDNSKYLCAHNGKEFDFPFMCRRLIIHGLPLPSLLNNNGKKPWEVNYLDTMEMWKFGDYKDRKSTRLNSSHV